MAKTKSRSTRSVPATKMPAQTPANMAMGRYCNCGCDHGVDAARCWMCWLFKTLIVLFTAFLILWAGFYFGMMSMYPYKYHMDPALEQLLKERRGEKMNMENSMPTMSRDMSNASMEQMMGDMTAALKGKAGLDFDREFLMQMIVHHEGAVDMAKMVLEKSQNQELKDFAQRIIDTQSAEIKQMQAWQAAQ